MIVTALLILPPGCHKWLFLPQLGESDQGEHDRLAAAFIVAAFRRPMPSKN